jgi:hypothetical protein
MKYSATHKQFLITQEELSRFTDEMKHAMRSARKIAGVSMGKRDMPQLLDIDHFEKNILSAMSILGVDFGVKWGADLDLSNMDDHKE